MREARKKQNIKPAYKLVDICAGEVAADESRPSKNKKVVILGGRAMEIAYDAGATGS